MGQQQKATLALFAYSSVTPETHDCILREAKAWPELQHYRVSGDALIDRQRSRAASDFLEAGRKAAGDVLIMVDHDMVWQRGNLRHLADACRQTKGVVGGIYSKRSFGGGIPVRLDEPGEHVVGSDRLVPATYVSTGFIAIHRRVLESIAEKMPKTIGDFYPFFIPVLATRNDKSVEYLSEDWAFCWRVREAGFSLDADLLPRLTHIGEWGYRPLDSLNPLAPDHPITITINPEVENRILSSLPLDVAEFTGIARDSFTRAASDARRALAALWHNEGGFDKEAAWYLRDDVGRCQLLDQAGWHITEHLPALVELTKVDMKGQRVLDFGAGIGTMALLLAEDNRVETVEVNGALNEFARYRAKRLGLELHQLPTPTGQYDVVICWHVLEHVPDPAQLTKMLAAHLRPGGQLLTHSDFRRGPLHPMHHDKVDADALWREAGLVQQGGEGGAWWVKIAAVADPDVVD